MVATAAAAAAATAAAEFEWRSNSIALLSSRRFKVFLAQQEKKSESGVDVSARGGAGALVPPLARECGRVVTEVPFLLPLVTRARTVDVVADATADGVSCPDIRSSDSAASCVRTFRGSESGDFVAVRTIASAGKFAT